METLSRLQARDVLKYLSVCRGWKALTSTRKFAELNHKLSVPTVIVDHVLEGLFRNTSNHKIYLVDAIEEASIDDDDHREEKEDEDSYYSRVVNPLPESSSSSCNRQELCFSCNGLVVFRDYFPSKLGLCHYILLNPNTEERVRLIAPGGSNIYGIFFHPFLEDHPYTVLWGRLGGTLFHEKIQAGVAVLGVG